MEADDDEFLQWFGTEWKDAEDALHDGDAAPRFETWSDREPVTLFGAWLTAHNVGETYVAFRQLASTFSHARECTVDLLAHGVNGDLAYTVAREITSTTVRGEARDYVLRVTQVYRREDGAWKVVHRHADNEAVTGGP
ncbi:MAG: nuclear transport factor 2 family protein [Nocardioides sp.]|nr:nuclear transport factor 2 family protein [Nocardioides sp.]